MFLFITRCMFLVFLFWYSFLQAWVDHSCDYFHICTVANYSHPNLIKLMQSCRMHGIQLKVLGMNLPWYGGGTKLVHVRKYLNSLPEQDIVLFVDAFDVLIIADKRMILEQFLKMKRPFIMAAEKNCWPLYACQNHEGPVSSSPFKYINSGTYIGYVKYLKEWIDDLAPHSEACDQAQIIFHWNQEKNKKFYHFDHYCELFLPLYLVDQEEVQINQDHLYCVTTQSYPCVIHANGSSFYPIWNRTYELLIKPAVLHKSPYGRFMQKMRP
jgi:hypothetical protein